MKDNIILEKSMNFSVRIVRLYKYLCDEKKNILCQNNFCVEAQVSEQIFTKLITHRQKKIFYQKCIYHLKKLPKQNIG
jgi:hypothetical protein